MLIHGRLFLTHHGQMLDEVRSLLQKALRRPESAKMLALQSCKELIGHGKDQLPWKCLVTYLFEDHCLADAPFLEVFWQSYEQNDKFCAVELLTKCKTCRVAACLPVVSMEAKYHPKDFDRELPIAEPIQGLVSRQTGAIDFDLLLANLCQAWLSTDIDKLISYMKLASIIVDHESRTVTHIGTDYLLEASSSKPNIGLVVLSALYKHTTDAILKRYIRACFRLASVKDTPTRLIMFAPITQIMYNVKSQLETAVVASASADAAATSASPVPPAEMVSGQVLDVGKVNWDDIEPLSCMPDWAVDKHTFRGKVGKGSKHLLKKNHTKLTEKEIEIFHGVRPKRDLAHFFDVAVQIENPSIPENPFWQDTKDHYFKYSKGLQKTVRMTAVFYKEIKQQYPTILYRSSGQATGKQSPSMMQMSDGEGTSNVAAGHNTRMSAKRKLSTDVMETSSKRLKKSDICSPEQQSGLPDVAGPSSSASSKQADSTSSDPLVTGRNELQSKEKLVSGDILSLGPLLQLPTGSAKVYTVFDEGNDRVVKGPYGEKKYKLTMFFHETMTKLIKDPHTLPVTDSKPYIIFPVLRDTTKSLNIIKKPFYDAIARKEVEDGRFVERGGMGIVQCHRLALEDYALLPATLWAHFLFRFALNVGDSGLYNAITDDKLSFVYGIDMEEERGQSVKGNTILHYMFTKLPRKVVCDKLQSVLASQRDTLLKIFTDCPCSDTITKLADIWGVKFDGERYSQRIEQIKSKLRKE